MTLNNMMMKYLPEKASSEEIKIPVTNLVCKDINDYYKHIKDENKRETARKAHSRFLAEEGLTPGKDYICKRISWLGNGIDIIIENNDFGETEIYNINLFKII